MAYQTCDWNTLVWHSGALSDGYRSIVMLLPDRGVAIVELSNLFGPDQDIEAMADDGARLLDEVGVLPRRV